jgi:REP element-mobilizing transposase RayT
MALYHVNFHTLGSRPVFELPEWDATIRQLILDTLARHCILCPVWEVMLTHIHMIVFEFGDLSGSRVVHLVKGAAAHGFFRIYPFLREDLLGGHLWTKGYYWTEITSQRQYRATVEYIRDNRTTAGLEPPSALAHLDVG